MASSSGSGSGGGGGGGGVGGGGGARLAALLAGDALVTAEDGRVLMVASRLDDKVVCGLCLSRMRVASLWQHLNTTCPVWRRDRARSSAAGDGDGDGETTKGSPCTGSSPGTGKAISAECAQRVRNSAAFRAAQLEIRGTVVSEDTARRLQTLSPELKRVHAWVCTSCFKVGTLCSSLGIRARTHTGCSHSRARVRVAALQGAVGIAAILDTLGGAAHATLMEEAAASFSKREGHVAVGGGGDEEAEHDDAPRDARSATSAAGDLDAARLARLEVMSALLAKADEWVAEAQRRRPKRAARAVRKRRRLERARQGAAVELAACADSAVEDSDRA